MNYFVKRFGQAVFTVFTVITFTFALIRMLPGGPAEYIKARIIGQNAGSVSPEEMERINALVKDYVNIDPNKALWQQYLEYIASILHGDLGQSIWYNEAVTHLITDALPWTILLMATSILLSFTLGISIGAIMAYTEGSKLDVGLSTAFTLLTSIPYYVVAVVAVYILAYQFGWFPTGGRVGEGVTAGFNLEYVGSIAYHAALPIASVVITGAGGRALGMRGNSIRVMGEDYLRVARLRGLRSRRIALHYVARNAVLPMYTNFMIAIGFLFGGAVILEQIFRYRGIGLLLFKSINTRDYPLMMGTFLIITLAVVTGLFIADLTYGKLDPRVESGGEAR
ncbi:MAG: ABC transporter permease [Halosimplex sp.]